MSRDLRVLGQQGLALYAKDRWGILWDKVLPDGDWCPVAY